MKSIGGEYADIPATTQKGP